MENINKFLSNYRKGKLLAIFPHPDDESFVSAGLFQILEKKQIKTKVVFLTSGENHKNKDFDPQFSNKRKSELDKASKILGIDNIEMLNHIDGDLMQSKLSWSKELKKIIKTFSPDIILSYGPGGITGHPDHIITSIEIYNILKNQKSIKLLWRVSSVYEKEHFEKGYVIAKPQNPTHYFHLTLRQSIEKLKAIYSYKSQFNDLIFRFRVLEWYLFDHTEFYHLVDFKKKVEYKLNI